MCNQLSQKIFFLSIYKQYVDLILEGKKLWEFRQNPSFGKDLNPGDVLFIISTFEDKTAIPQINCLATVSKLLRGDEINQYFGNKDSERWLEAGCSENSERNWNYFTTTILPNYQTALQLEARPILPAVSVGEIIHSRKATHWSGRGFCPIENLKRFSIHGMDVHSYFHQLHKNLVEQ